jgi:hypothetical protein
MDKPIKENDDACDSLRYFVSRIRNVALLTMDDISM